MQDRARQVHFSHASPFVWRLVVRDLGQMLFFGFPTTAAYYIRNENIRTDYVKTGEKVCTAEYDYDDIVSYYIYYILLKCTCRVMCRYARWVAPHLDIIYEV